MSFQAHPPPQNLLLQPHYWFVLPFHHYIKHVLDYLLWALEILDRKQEYFLYGASKYKNSKVAHGNFKIILFWNVLGKYIFIYVPSYKIYANAKSFKAHLFVACGCPIWRRRFQIKSPSNLIGYGDTLSSYYLSNITSK